jgi:hypothetical protein
LLATFKRRNRLACRCVHFEVIKERTVQNDPGKSISDARWLLAVPFTLLVSVAAAGFILV